MSSLIPLANIFRWTARALSILVILCAVPYLLFVGLQLLSGESGLPALTLYLLFTVILLVGLVVAWWREGMGSGIALVAMLAIFGQSLAFPRYATTMGSPLLGPLTLIMALVMPGYHPDASPIAGVVQTVAWVLTVAPSVLFLASWLLRRKPQVSADTPAPGYQ